MKKVLAIILATNVALSAFGAEITMSLSKGSISATSATVNYTLKNTIGTSLVKQTGWARLHLISEYDDKWVTIRSISNATSTFENNSSYHRQTSHLKTTVQQLMQGTSPGSPRDESCFERLPSPLPSVRSLRRPTKRAARLVFRSQKSVRATRVRRLTSL